MGIGPVPPPTSGARAGGSRLDDFDLFELTMPFSAQVLTLCDELGVAEDDRGPPVRRRDRVGQPLAGDGPFASAATRVRLPRARAGTGSPAVLGMGMGASDPVCLA